jgi:hypothetical protein
MNQYPSMQHTGTKAEIINAFMRGVYGWMSAGLGLTAVVAFLTLTTPVLQQLVFNIDPATGQVVGISSMVMILMVAELAMVFFLSARIGSMNPSTATGLFLAYSAMNGITLTPILFAYTTASVVSAFVTTAGMFGAMSLYGMVTKKDLTGMGSLMFMGLIGIIIASVVNMFIGSSAMSFAISVIGVIVFLGLTAYDTQRLKTMGEMMPEGDAGAVRRGTIMGALSLYLNFINLFIMLLSLMGNRD